MKTPNNCTVGILGCGWLGQALAKKLVSKSYKVRGTTTQNENLKTLEKIGIDSFKIEIYSDHVKGNLKSFLKNLDVLIIAIPPKLRQTKDSLKKGLEYIFKTNEFSTLKNLIHISSTGVFADGKNKFYNENSMPNNKSSRGEYLKNLEALVLEQKQIQNINILRLGGLVEYGGRHPIHYLSGKTEVSNPKAPINLIEKEDAVNIIVKIIENKPTVQKYFHGVYPKHTERETYYTDKATELKIKPPSFEKPSLNEGKIIKSEITQNLLEFKYSNQP
ncbi:NAD(P)-binding domain-containing protein [Mesohalobacter salilacus]|uniref:NAD(P)-binding domain-containing protein n=1 Tax=Mesohalobacter salilacus TaxID=2491711 RepID=UPI0026B83E4D